jgi:hypothetical protein
MSERKNTSARTALCRAVCVLLLAASAAACDKCGDFVPLRLLSDQQPETCRDETPRG